ESPLVPSSTPLSIIKIKWPIFFALLLVPPLLTALSAIIKLTALSAIINHGVRNESISSSIGLFGGGAAGIVCGIMLGLRLGKTLAVRVVLSIFLAALMVCVCVMLCFFGCTLGGYQLRFG